MYHLLNFLRKSKIVTKIEILNFIDEENLQLLYLKATLVDGSILFIRELTTQTENKYSYHWQTKNGKLICRWDNAPHYPKIETFPHHKHLKTKTNVLPSKEITPEQIFKVITKE